METIGSKVSNCGELAMVLVCDRKSPVNPARAYSNRPIILRRPSPDSSKFLPAAVNDGCKGGREAVFVCTTASLRVGDGDKAVFMMRILLGGCR